MTIEGSDFKKIFAAKDVTFTVPTCCFPHAHLTEFKNIDFKIHKTSMWGNVTPLTGPLHFGEFSLSHRRKVDNVRVNPTRVSAQYPCTRYHLFC